MKRICFCAVAFTLALLFPVGVIAQGRESAGTAAPQKEAGTPASVRIAGVLRTERGVRVPGATVRAVNLATGQAWATWTDEDGTFALPGLPPGRYRLEARILGLGSASREAEFSGNTSGPAELILHLASAAEKPAQASSQPATTKATERAATGAVNASPSKPVAESSSESANSAPIKKHHHAGTRAGESSSSARATPSKAAPAAANSANAAASSETSATVAKARSRKPHPAGFKDVDTTGEAAATDETEQGQESANSSPPNTDSLGNASSSDAFLMKGTVGRGTSGAPMSLVSGFGGTGTPGDLTGNEDQSAAGNLFGNLPNNASAGGKRRQGHHRGGKHRARARASSAGGIEGLLAQRRVSRLSANRVRFGFYNKYYSSVWAARPYVITGPPVPKLSHYDDQFGVHLGGPLYLPRIYNGKDRTFFFVSYEGDRQRVPTDQFTSVPLPAWRHGDFSSLGIPLYDPQSNFDGPRALLGNGSVIPPSRLDPAALKLLEFIPLPNLPGIAENFHLQRTLPLASDRLNVRILHTISPKLNFQAFYFLNQQREDALLFFASFGSHTSIRGQNLILGLTQNLTDRFIHDTRINWNRSRIQLVNNFAFRRDVAGELGIRGVSTAPIDFGVPFVSFTNVDLLTDPVPSLVRDQTFRLIDSVGYTLPRHSFRAGVEIRRIQNNSLTDPTPRGSFDFTGLLTSQLDAKGNPIEGTGFDFADFLLGLPTDTMLRYGSPNVYFRNWGYIGYFQDDWRIHPRFTFDYGVRYEAVTPPIELFNHIANLDLNSDISAVATVVPGQPGPFSGRLPRSLIRGEYNNWAPRVGFAWRPLNNLPVVVRGGYSIFYNESIYKQLSSSLFDQPPWAQTLNRLTSTKQVLTLENGFPPQPLTTILNTMAVDPNYRVGSAQVWNLSVETRFPGNWLTEITYTGTKGTHLDLLRVPNRAAPGSQLTAEDRRRIANASGFIFGSSGASSIYHGLQVRVERHLAHGFLVRGLYTFGKSIDNASSIGGSKPFIVQNDQNFRAERGLSSFDIRHQFIVFYSYELPFGERHRWLRGGLSSVFGNWRISGNTTIATGTPFTAQVQGAFEDIAGTGITAARADQVGNPNLAADQRTPLRWFNTAAFAIPAPGHFGNAARNTIPGPGVANFNFALAHWVHFGKDQRYRVEMKWEVQNLMNTPNFLLLKSIVNSSSYGSVRAVRPMRTMDLMLRVHF